MGPRYDRERVLYTRCFFLLFVSICCINRADAHNSHVLDLMITDTLKSIDLKTPATVPKADINNRRKKENKERHGARSNKKGK